MGGLTTPMPPDLFKAGLLDLRAKLEEVDANYGTYIIEGTQHTWLAGGDIYTHMIGDVRMIDWITDIVEGTGTSHVGP
jgi:hypothetical protein